jgi:peptide/nickel transport system permease protein
MTLIVASAAVVLGGSVGFAMGLLAGYRGGIVDSVIMRLVDLQLAFPSLFIGLVAMGLLGAGVVQLVCVIALTQWADYARIVRGEVLKIRESPYVEGAHALGLRDFRIVRLYITPNVLSSLVIVATFSLAVAIYYESALSFFGLGVPPSIPTWGNMLSQARDLMVRTPWLAVFPGLAITLTVLSFNLLGDWLRDYLDVKLRQ